MKCKRCGWALEEWQKFCPGCGTPAPRGTAPWLWGGAMVLLAGVIGLLGYRVYALHEAQNTPVAQVRPAPAAPETTPPAAPGPPPEKTAKTPATPPPVMRIEEPTPRRAPELAASKAPPPVSPPTEAKESEAAAPKRSTRRINIPKDDFDEPVAKAPPADTAAAPDAAAGIPVVPAGPRPSVAPRPKIGILRPERPEPVASRGEPISPSPPASAGGTSAQPATAAPYTGPSAGTLIWSGEIGENTLVVINGTEVSRGRLTGELPGVPVIIQLETDDFMVIDPPGPGNGWKRLSLRSRRRLRHAVTIKWGVMR
jgi:hypothetical protein